MNETRNSTAVFVRFLGRGIAKQARRSVTRASLCSVRDIGTKVWLLERVSMMMVMMADLTHHGMP